MQSEKNFNQEVFDRIKSGQVKMRPRWKFVAEKLGVESGLALSFLLSVMLLSMLWYYAEVNELDHILSFGIDGIMEFAGDFPYEIFIFGALFLGGLVFFVRKLEYGHKRTLLFWSGSAVIVIFSTSLLVHVAGLHHKIEAGAAYYNAPGLNGYYQDRLHNISNSSIIGRILNDLDDGLEVENHNNSLSIGSSSLVKLNLSQLKTEVGKAGIKVGNCVKVLGRKTSAGYQPWALKSLPAANCASAATSTTARVK